MALRQLGLANEIISLAFGLTLGAIAVALALAFGLGGRETAAQLLENWRREVESNETQTRPTPARATAKSAAGGGGEE